MVVSTAACGPNSSGAVSLVPRFVHESVHHIRPTSVPTRGLALQVIQAARSSPELAMELKRLRRVARKPVGTRDPGLRAEPGWRPSSTPYAAAYPPGWTKGPTRPHPAPPPRGLLRPPRLQRPYRSHQRAPRSPPQKRPRIPQPHPLPTALTPALRQPHPTDRRTLIPEEPLSVQP